MEEYTKMIKDRLFKKQIDALRAERDRLRVLLQEAIAEAVKPKKVL